MLRRHRQLLDQARETDRQIQQSRAALLRLQQAGVASEPGEYVLQVEEREVWAISYHLLEERTTAAFAKGIATLVGPTLQTRVNIAKNNRQTPNRTEDVFAAV